MSSLTSILCLDNRATRSETSTETVYFLLKKISTSEIRFFLAGKNKCTRKLVRLRYCSWAYNCLSKEWTLIVKEEFTFGLTTEAAVQWCSEENAFWKQAGNLQDNTQCYFTSAWVFSCKFAVYYQNNFS